MNVKEILKKLTLEEKISLLEGKTSWITANIDRCEVPSIWLSDGPHGVRKEIEGSEGIGFKESVKSVCFPSESTIGCSFDRDLAYKMGQAIGEEARNQDVHIVLGPGLNIKRNPLCGRNFEYFSEDPYVTGEMGKYYVNGIQSNNVGACIKHFACNNQEKNRMVINSVVDERALREIYLKAFEMNVKNGVSSVMCSYNKLNGTYTSENKYLLNEILRQEWKYKGITMTDWGAVNNRVLGLKNGIDLEMPTSYGYHSKQLEKAYKNYEITNEEIDLSCERILNAVNKYSVNKKIDCDYNAHHELAREIGANSSVLLKCENNILPLKAYDKVLFIGSLAKKCRYQGGGSSFTNSYKIDNVVENISLYSEKTTYCDGYSLEGDGYDKNLISEACDLAKKHFKVVVFIGLFDHYEQEGTDRENIELPKGQVKLLEELYKANKNVILVVQTGSIVNLDISSKAKGLILEGLGGEASGLSILDNLYGKVVPSGRLTESYCTNIDEYITTKNYNKTNSSVYYSESIFVGYRYFTTFNKKVLFPFGYGLSYTNFEYSNLKLSSTTITKNKKVKVTVDVKNTGNVAAQEVVLLFVQNNEGSPVFKAKRELREFAKVFLEPNQIKTISFDLDYNSFSYYDTKLEKNHVDIGYYKVQICKDCETVILEKELERKENEPGYERPQVTSYNRRDKLVISDQDFEGLCGYKLPPKQINHYKTITLENNLNDVKHTLAGKIVINEVRKQLMKQFGKDAVAKVSKVEEEQIMEIPFKTLALFSEGQFGYDKMEGVLDILNGHYLRGYKKIK